MTRRLESALSIILTACAVAMSVTVVYRQLHPATQTVVRKPTRVDQWDQLLNGPSRIGARSAPIQIVEFGDFQCPFCRLFHADLDTLMAELPDKVGFVFRQYPLKIHTWADEAARASVCATDQGRFAQMEEAFFAHQDLLGVENWRTFATHAGVADTARFSACMDDSLTEVRVEADHELGTRAGVLGTPTVIVNGWMLPLPPPIDSLRSIAHTILAGQPIFGSR